MEWKCYLAIKIEIFPFLTIWVDFEGIRLSEINQTKKNKKNKKNAEKCKPKKAKAKNKDKS